MDPRARCWREMCFKEEEEEEEEEEEILPKTRNIDSILLRWQISPSLSLSTSPQIRGTEKSGRNCFIRLLVDPRYTTSAVVKGRWCAEAVPPRTKRDSQYIAQTASPKKPTSGEHEWLLYRHSFVSSVSLHSLGSSSHNHNFFSFVISRLIDRQSSILT